MPLIQLKTTAELTPALRDELTSDFGKMMAEAGKPESFLMIAFEDSVDLRFSGEKMKNGALASRRSRQRCVSLFDKNRHPYFE